MQSATDAAKIAVAGFIDTRVLRADTAFSGVSMTKTDGQHGSDEAIARISDRLGQVCGVVFRYPDEKVLYLAGDTVWNHHVSATLTEHRPEVVIVNAGAALIHAAGHIIMGTEDVLAVHHAAPEVRFIASHMEALNHCTLSRAECETSRPSMGLREFWIFPKMVPRSRSDRSISGRSCARRP